MSYTGIHRHKLSYQLAQTPLPQGRGVLLVELKTQRSHLEAEGKRVFAETGSARFLAAQLGTDAETVIRWLVLALVLLIDPSAIVLTIAATMRTLRSR